VDGQAESRKTAKIRAGQRVQLQGQPAILVQAPQG
jgi:ribosome-associated protein YbcJ (S4-like RNA binding protein)